MRKLSVRISFVLLVLLSLTSFIYLNRCTSVQERAALLEFQEFNTARDQVITGVKYVTAVMDKVVDIVTSRNGQ